MKKILIFSALILSLSSVGITTLACDCGKCAQHSESGDEASCQSKGDHSKCEGSCNKAGHKGHHDAKVKASKKVEETKPAEASNSSSN